MPPTNQMPKCSKCQKDLSEDCFEINPRTKKSYKCCTDCRQKCRDSFAMTIASHKRCDKKANRTWVESEYIDNAWILDQQKGILSNGNRCSVCDCILVWCNCSKHEKHAWSVDRLDNAVAHTKSNCRIICYNCNQAKEGCDEKPIVAIKIGDEDNVQWFAGQMDAARTLNLDVSHINHILRGDRQNHGGYRFEYWDDWLP